MVCFRSLFLLFLSALFQSYLTTPAFTQDGGTHDSFHKDRVFVDICSTPRKLDHWLSLVTIEN
ncbi:MAG: hypothetical protein ABEH38_06790, partial [Flavobacteriales bacterium]